MPNPVHRILIFGATNGVGQGLLSMLSQLSADRALDIHAISRQPPNEPPLADPNGQESAFLAPTSRSVHWHALDLKQTVPKIETDVLISLGPIQHVVDYLTNASNRPSVVWALSSASTDFKFDSEDSRERVQMAEILATEKALVNACQTRHIHWQLLKTTLLYGRDDHNINRLAGLIRNLRWVPVLGEGRRAPVHVDDVAKLIVDALGSYIDDARFIEGEFRLQGGEILTYPQMLECIAQRRRLSGRPIKMPTKPLHAVLKMAHAIGLLKDVSQAMLARQSADLILDDHEARQQLGWAPRGFEP